MRPRIVLREAIASARAQPVASIVAAIMIAGMCLAVLLTHGRSIGAQQQIVSTLDDAGTRSIIVRMTPSAEVDTSVLHRLRDFSSVSWTAAFGAADDAVNAANTEGNPVAVRKAYGLNLADLNVEEEGLAGGVYASPAALSALGMDGIGGSILRSDGIDKPLVGMIDVPEHLKFLEPLLIEPVEDSSNHTARGDSIAILVALAKDAAHHDSSLASIQSVLDTLDPSAVSIEASSQIAELREIVNAQLGGFGHIITIAIFGITGLLVAVMQTGLVMMKRRDFGRRRALGASQKNIVALILMQTFIVSLFGAVIGCVSAFALSHWLGDPRPSFAYYAAIATLAVTIGTVASLTPAVVAARRDPAHEIRVP